MTFDISSLFPDLEALTPDGRWNMLQDWLKQNPEYQERIEDWSTQSVDQVFVEIRGLAFEKYGPLSGFAFSAAPVAAKIKSAIEILQTCYRERAGQQTEKEIENGRPQRTIEKRSRKNSGRTNAR